MRVLVLGGTGFIGSALVRQLCLVGHTVVVFHRGQSHGDLPEVGHLLGDRDRLAENASAFRWFAPEVVVDLIAYHEHQAQALLATFRGLAGRLIVVSSGDVYRAYGLLLGTETGAARAGAAGRGCPAPPSALPVPDQGPGARRPDLRL